MNTPVKFEIAKLLKEKGFNLKVINFYNYEKLSTPFDKQRQVDGLINYNPINWNSVKNHYTSAPTISEVVMWLYEKHGIWVSVEMNGDFSFHQKYVIVEKSGKQSKVGFKDETGRFYRNSPTEAYSAAIEYTLENLIKEKV